MCSNHISGTFIKKHRIFMIVFKLCGVLCWWPDPRRHLLLCHDESDVSTCRMNVIHESSLWQTLLAFSMLGSLHRLGPFPCLLRSAVGGRSWKIVFPPKNNFFRRNHHMTSSQGRRKIQTSSQPPFTEFHTYSASSFSPPRT